MNMGTSRRMAQRAGAFALGAALVGILCLAQDARADEPEVKDDAAKAAAATGTITGVVKNRWVARYPAAVFVTKVEGKSFKPAALTVPMNQEKMLFIPRVLAIQVGTTVSFMNDDPVIHNVFSPGDCEAFDLGNWGQGDKRNFTFTKAGCVATVLCKLHPEMVAFVVVTSTPYFAVTDAKGNFSMKDLPPGTYTLTSWHEKLRKPDTKTVEVKAGATVVLELHPKKR